MRDDLGVSMEQVNFKIEKFEGPLDLLLHLVARHKVALTEVKISLLIDQYLDFIGSVGPDELDPTSEFVEMAARLVHLKSAALLPRPEEAEALERELVGQLVEYQLCKIAAEKLRYMSEGVYYAVRDPLAVKLPEEYKGKHKKDELLQAFMGLMGRGVRGIEIDIGRFEDIVVAPVVSVSSRVIFILRGLRKGVVQNVKELFFKAKNRSESIATFLGLLELIKAKRVAVEEDGGLIPGERGEKAS